MAQRVAEGSLWPVSHHRRKRTPTESGIFQIAESAKTDEADLLVKLPGKDAAVGGARSSGSRSRSLEWMYKSGARRRSLMPPLWMLALGALLLLQLSGALFLSVSSASEQADAVEERNSERHERSMELFADLIGSQLLLAKDSMGLWREILPLVPSAAKFNAIFNRPLVGSVMTWVRRVAHSERAQVEQELHDDLSMFLNSTLVPRNLTALVPNATGEWAPQVVSPVKPVYYVIQYASPPLPFPRMYMRDVLSEPLSAKLVMDVLDADGLTLASPRLVGRDPQGVLVALTSFAIEVPSETNASKPLGVLTQMVQWSRFVPGQLTSAPYGPLRLRVYDVTGDQPDQLGCDCPVMFSGEQDRLGAWTVASGQSLLVCPPVAAPAGIEQLVTDGSLYRDVSVAGRTYRLVLTRLPGFDEELTNADVLLSSASFLVIMGMIPIVFLTAWLIVRHVRHADKATEEYVQDLTEAELSARKAKEHRDQFLAFLSHELRNPLFGLQGVIEEGTERTRRCADEQLRGELSADFATLHSCSQQIERTLNTVVNVQNMTNGKIVLHKSEFNLERLLDRLRAKHGDIAQRRRVGLRFTIDKNVPKVVVGDRQRVKEAVSHALHNAVQCTHVGTVVSCRVRLAPITDRSPLAKTNTLQVVPIHDEDNYDLVYKTDRSEERQISRSVYTSELGDSRTINVQFVIRDEGPGMTDKQIERAFQPYTRERIARASQGRGSNLGLPLVKLLAEQMAGYVRVRSAVGRGCEFTIMLQLGVSGGAQVSLDVDKSPDNSGSGQIDLGSFDGHFLVVDDHHVNRRLVSRLLTKIMPLARVDVAEDGVQAVERVSMAAEDGDPYSCVFMDIQMPRMNGTEATRQLRARNFEAPIIAVTGGSLEEEVAKYRASGMDAVIHKPCKKADFEAKLSEFWAAITSRAVSRSQRSSSRAGARAGASSPIHLLPGSA